MAFITESNVSWLQLIGTSKILNLETTILKVHSADFIPGESLQEKNIFLSSNSLCGYGHMIFLLRGKSLLPTK
jgi:hypothetical protein